jgi:hypothetical protein
VSSSTIKHFSSIYDIARGGDGSLREIYTTSFPNEKGHMLKKILSKQTCDEIERKQTWNGGEATNTKVGMVEETKGRAWAWIQGGNMAWVIRQSWTM